MRLTPGPGNNQQQSSSGRTLQAHVPRFFICATFLGTQVSIFICATFFGTQVSNLAPVAMTLERLCLVDQKLTRMEGLRLPCLRELCLQQNQISSIEGLDECPRLQRLWLYGNKISRIEGLANCGELRELCLQSNRISRVAGLSGLVHLEHLALADNRVSEYRELSSLAHLPVLKELSLRDVHFGSNPVCTLAGYRSAALLALKQIQVANLPGGVKSWLSLLK